MTADAAISGIREVRPGAEIALFSREPHPPYNRPPLTKGLWQDMEEAEIWRRKDPPSGVEYHLGRSITRLDREERIVVDDRGDAYRYENLLLATGGKPRRLSDADEGVVYYRTLEDYRVLRRRTAQGGRWAVLGGGFIGSEIAASLSQSGCDVIHLFAEVGICGRLFPAGLADFLNGYYRAKGVQVEPRRRIRRVRRQGSLWRVESDGAAWTVDGVVAGLGIDPETELAARAGLAVDNGIQVDEQLRASDNHIYAAGDVAAFGLPRLDRRLRVEHEDNANTMGRFSGRAMAGEPAPYTHLPMFYSDLFDLGYEAVGDVRSEMETIESWEEPHRKGVVYYRESERVVGVLLWNVWQQVEAARALIACGETSSPRALEGRLPA